MPTQVSKEIELEIAYVLFIDIVGYSKLVTHEQRRLLDLLNRIVREAEHFRAAEANGRLITVPTGDGMALVFYNTRKRQWNEGSCCDDSKPLRPALPEEQPSSLDQKQDRIARAKSAQFLQLFGMDKVQLC